MMLVLAILPPMWEMYTASLHVPGFGQTLAAVGIWRVSRGGDLFLSLSAC